MLEFLVQIFGDLCFELAIAIGDCTWECCCVLHSEAGAVDVFAAEERRAKLLRWNECMRQSAERFEMKMGTRPRAL
ncbi:MAG: hypothetical protein DMG58_25760 [Acidobacteria bacterium]|nr:MAG: hypothetical protein DMG58_25760 [Acidobacteriota bacterium]